MLAMPSVMNVIPSSLRILFELLMRCSDAGRGKTLGVPVVISGDNLPSPVGIEMTDLPNMGGGQWPPLAPPVPASLLGRYSVICNSSFKNL